MTKSIFFSVFSMVLFLAFAFTPVNESAVKDACSMDDAVAGCCGHFKSESACITAVFPPNLGPTITLTDPFGNTSVIPPGYFPTMLPFLGTYTVTITANTFCSVTLGWEFCGGVSNGGNTYNVSPGNPAVDTFTIIDFNC